MKFIIKFFPEITIKSKPVRKQFVKQLQDNLYKVLRGVDPELVVRRDWDKLVVEVSASNDNDQVRQELILQLGRISGIAYFLEVDEYPLPASLDELALLVADYWLPLIADKTFAVRCKRSGKHDFSSSEVERTLGAYLFMQQCAKGVDLKNPDVTVSLEIRDDSLFLVKQRYAGVGGFPLGSVDPVLSLLSGGFDSPVASYMTMRRGMPTHFCFFNLGGRDHERGVKEVATYLWLRYGSARPIKFVTVPFEQVVAEILKNVSNSQMGVVLKRMMMRAAAEVAEKLNIEALVTGESVAQVSSQTVTNLSVIDAVTDTLILRPLVTADKGDIIDLARKIGTAEFAENMPEYCGVISQKPTTKAKRERIEAEEENFDFGVLEQALADARYANIIDLFDEEPCKNDVEVLSIPLHGSTILDVRHPTEVERKPLVVDGMKTGIAVQALPFYELHSRFADLDQSQSYLLYCDKGVMSKLHAAHLIEAGFANVKVYRP